MSHIGKEELSVIRAAADVVEDRLTAGDYDAAVAAARAILSATSKLHQRLHVFVELRADGAWSAAVDRAIRTGKRPELEGQMTVQDVIHPEKPGSPRRRKPNG